MENRTKFIIGGVLVALVIVIVLLVLSSGNGSTSYYDLACERALTLKEYSDCIRFEYAINN